jgi:hypothetical protein
MTFHYWGEDNGKTGNLFPSDPKTSTLKFEVNVVEPWNALGMLFFFIAKGQGNSPMWNGDYPAGIWMPWAADGKVISDEGYTTDGWITVSMPLSQFVYNCQGNTPTPAFPPAFEGLTIVVMRGGVEGVECSPLILMDNIRVIP